MDPLSAIVSVVGMLDVVTRLGTLFYGIQSDMRTADKGLEAARQQLKLLKQEIGMARNIRKDVPAEDATSSSTSTVGDQFTMTPETFTQALSVAESLLTDIEKSFPSTSGPLKWRTRIKYALRDKELCKTLGEKLRSVESTLQSILLFEQRTISSMMLSLLLQQKSTLHALENHQAKTCHELRSLVCRLDSPRSISRTICVRLAEDHTEENSANSHLDLWRSLAELAFIPPERKNRSRLSIRLSLFSKRYTAHLRLKSPILPSDTMLHHQNTVSSESIMVQACLAGNIGQVQRLLARGEAGCNDITEKGWPMLDYAIEGGSTDMVGLLLSHGANPNTAYRESFMTSLQSAFLRGRLDIARLLSKAGADINYIDHDGFSALSYLWVTEDRAKDSPDFLSYCETNGLSTAAINSTDDRGWAPVHRVAAIGTADDLLACLRLGASLETLTNWYGWTPIFFAASHDNVETFNVIVQHEKTDIHRIRDNDGWNLLHCCIYWGASRMTQILLQKYKFDVNTTTLPSSLPEDPLLKGLELTAREIALHMGPDHYRMLQEAMAAAELNSVLEDWDDVYWDAGPSTTWQSGNFNESLKSTPSAPDPVFGAEDINDQWTLLHWASYCSSPKIKHLLVLKGVSPARMKGITAYLPPTLTGYRDAVYDQGGEKRPFIPASYVVEEVDEDPSEADTTCQQTALGPVEASMGQPISV